MVLLILALVLPMESAFAVFCSGGAADFFYGPLKINGVNASADTDMRAKILGDVRGSYTTSVAGRYGNAQGIDKFLVSGLIEGYEVQPNITFEVFTNGQWTQALLNGSLQSLAYTCGRIHNVNMSVQTACPDSDGDSVCDANDECPGSDDNLDSDGDGTANGCDACPNDADNDIDSDTVCGDIDNCPADSNFNQADFDNDGLGDVCDPDDDNDGFSENEGDCDDNDADIFPEAFELCDNVDNDCNEATEDGSQEENYGQETDCSVGACQASGVMDCVNGQMVDTCQEPQVSDEVCDSQDNDCDGEVDENAPFTFYQDADFDFFGNVNIFQNACEEPQGFVEDNTDCDDTDEEVFPGAEEICGDGIDQDCNGSDLACDEPCPDADNDQICDDDDACPNDDDNDADGDGVCGDIDNCPDTPNDQTNSDDDGFGDACDDDDDNDDVDDGQDNCQTTPNEDQTNSDTDGLGDACDPDDDNDSQPDELDNCPTVENGDQTDTDQDGKGDVCDLCPNDANDDSDDDTFCDSDDNCPDDPNLDQADLDQDGIGTVCDENEDVFETSIQFYDGWTLFALPFKPSGIDNSEELGQAIMDATGLECDVVLRFNGETQEMESDILGQPDPSFILSGTEAYFIHCNAAGIFTYGGEPWE